jgi:hypothetical protein
MAAKVVKLPSRTCGSPQIEHEDGTWLSAPPVDHKDSKIQSSRMSFRMTVESAKNEHSVYHSVSIYIYKCSSSLSRMLYFAVVNTLPFFMEIFFL